MTEAGIMLAVLIPCVVFFAIGIAVLRPLDVAVKRTPYHDRGKVRFQLVDFLCLFVLIQLPFSLLGLWTNRAFHGGVVCVLVFLLTLGTAIWLTGVITLCRIRIDRPRQHFMVLGLILPLIYYGLMPYCYLLGGQLSEAWFVRGTSSAVVWTVLVLAGAVYAWCVRYMRQVSREALRRMTVATGRFSPGDKV